MLIRANVDKCFQTTTDICCFYDITILKQQNMIFIRDVPTTRFAGSGGGGVNGSGNLYYDGLRSLRLTIIFISSVLIRHSSSMAH